MLSWRKKRKRERGRLSWPSEGREGEAELAVRGKRVRE